MNTSSFSPKKHHPAEVFVPVELPPAVAPQELFVSVPCGQQVTVNARAAHIHGCEVCDRILYHK